jgi:imidazolonepropionase-like amidohydrolase
MHNYVVGLVIAVLSAGVAQATTVVTAAHMFDPVKGVTIDSPVVVIGDDGRVQSLVGGAGARPSIPADAKRIDLGNVTILPGLIDMHVHLTGDPTLSGYQGLEYTDNFWTVVGVANAQKTLEAGFTTVRMVGSANYDDVALKQGIDHGYVPGPRIVPATYAIGATGGHCDSTEFPPSVTVPSPNIANSPDQFRALVRTLRIWRRGDQGLYDRRRAVQDRFCRCAANLVRGDQGDRR